MGRDDNPMIVNILLSFEHRPDWDAVAVALVERVVNRYPRFRQRAVEPALAVGLLGPRWVAEETFDPRSQVLHVDVDGASISAALLGYIGEQAALPLDRSRPLWQFHCIDLPGDRGAVLLRTHHAMADGAGLSHVLSELTDPVSGASVAGSSPGPVRPLLRPVLQAGATAAKLGGRIVATPSSAPDHLSGIKTVSCSIDVPLAQLKAVGHGTHSTINDVMLATIAATLRRYRQHLGDEPADIDVVMPFNLRRSNPGELGNKFGLVFVTLPVSCDEPTERMALVTTQMLRIKDSHEPEVAFAALATMGSLPPGAQRAWIDSFNRDARAVITNVAGPRHAVTLAGTPLDGMVLWVPSTGTVGLGVSLFSYDGNATIGLIADTGVIADLDDLTDVLDDELRALPH
jgi:hypothetical protein